jgi:hypothetical protein
MDTEQAAKVRKAGQGIAGVFAGRIAIYGGDEVAQKVSVKEVEAVIERAIVATFGDCDANVELTRTDR